VAKLSAFSTAGGVSALSYLMVRSKTVETTPGSLEFKIH
jgi:hypothetical protein